MGAETGVGEGRGMEWDALRGLGFGRDMCAYGDICVDAGKRGRGGENGDAEDMGDALVVGGRAEGAKGEGENVVGPLDPFLSTSEDEGIGNGDDAYTNGDEDIVMSCCCMCT